MAGNFSQFIEPGVCNLTYVVFDSSNQAATLTRRVRFTDYEAPKFMLTQPLVFAVGTENNARSYVHATDQIDGDLSSMVKLLESNVDYRTAGDYTIQVEVSNSLGDTTQAELPVHIVEASQLSTDIHLTQSLVYVKKELNSTRKSMWTMWKIWTATSGMQAAFPSVLRSIQGKLEPIRFNIRQTAIQAEVKPG